MAKIEMFLQDGQNLGYVRMRNGKPYYSYPREEATDMPLQEAQSMCKRFSAQYKCKIHASKQEKPSSRIEISWE